MHKLFNTQEPQNEFLSLNFQLNDNQRSTKIVISKHQNYDVGKNILLNRMAELNGKIDKSWLNLSIDSFKI